VGGVLLAGLLLWWVFRGTDLPALMTQIRQASLLGLLLAAIVNLSQNVFRVWRWQALLTPVRAGVPFRPLFSAVILGYLVSWVIPGRLGEVVRPALVSGREKIPLAPVLGTVVADRVMDGIAILVLFAVGLWITPLQGQAAEHAAYFRGIAVVTVGAFVGVLAVMLAASRARPALETWVEKRGRTLRWLGRVVLAFSRGTEALHQPRLMVQIVVHSLLVWLVISAGLWIGVWSCGAKIPFGGMLIMMPIIALGVALPTPGGAGGFHAAITFGLTELFAVDPTVAVGAGILVHAIVFIPIIILGPTLIAIDRVPMGDLLAAARQVKDLGASPDTPATATPAAEATP
jgi:uncharacterized protein (TIRG00374 family)